MSAKAKEVAKITQAIPTTPNPMQILEAAVAKGVDAEQLSKLMDLQERYQANEARVAFTRAMADFQASCPSIKKSSQADRGIRYAGLDETLRTIRPHLDACGLSVRFSTKAEETMITAFCHVSHRDGHTETSEFTAPVDSNMRANSTQKMGSANSYAKRYALNNALNLVGTDIDDDANSLDSVITGEEAQSIEADLEALKVNKVKFCKFMEVASIREMSQAKLPIAENFINAKRKAQ